jgi:hypothetical protein
MSAWLETWPVAVAALTVALAPGVLPAYALGLRGLVAWGTAPLLGGAVVGGAAVAAGALGIGWGWFPVALAVLVASGAAWGLRRVSRRGEPLPERRTDGPDRWVVALGAGVAVLATALQVRRTVLAVGEPGRIAQTWDTTYHLNSVALILDRGDASSLHMTLTRPEGGTAFYPALWHGLVSLVVRTTGAEIPVAANWVSTVTGSVVWALGMLALMRVLLGRNAVWLAMVVPSAFAFTQFPNRLFSFGILYPNLLSYALLPAAFALAAAGLLGVTGRRRVAPLAGLAAGCVALVLAQPNGLFALAFLGIPLVVAALAQATLRMLRRGAPMYRVVLPWVATAAGAAATLLVVSRIPIVAAFRGNVVWTTAGTVPNAFVEALTLSAMHPATTPNFPEPEQLGGGIANWAVAVLVVVGAVAAARIPRLTWLPVGYAVSGLLYVVVRAVDLPIRGALTGYWYADPQRLAALLPVLGVPLVVVACGTVVDAIARRAGAAARPAGSPRHAGAGRPAHPAVGYASVAVIALALTVALPRTETFRTSFQYVGHAYRLDPRAEGSTGLLDAEELALMRDIREIVPPGDVIAGDPADGSALTWALADREALFAYFGMANGDRAVIAQRLREATTSPDVCEAVRRTGVDYVLRGGTTINGGVSEGFEGLDGLVEAGVGRLVANRGDAHLYEITACED